MIDDNEEPVYFKTKEAAEKCNRNLEEMVTILERALLRFNQKEMNKSNQNKPIE